MEEILKEFDEKFADVEGEDFEGWIVDKNGEMVGSFEDQTSSGLPIVKSWLKEKLTAFEKQTKEEFLKRILPEERKTIPGKYTENIDYTIDAVFNSCRDEIITNANKEGIGI